MDRDHGNALTGGFECSAVAAGTHVTEHSGVYVSWFDTAAVPLTLADILTLDPAERERAAALLDHRDRHRFLAAHVMLRKVLAQRAQTAPGLLRFGREPCPACGRPAGKPVLSSSPDVHFSLAHSGDVVAIALADSPVGIDVEQPTSACVCALTELMPEDDAAAIKLLAEPTRHAAVLSWWVRAEATLKCAGQGIRHGLRAADGLADPRVAMACPIRVGAVSAPRECVAALAVRSAGP